MPILSYTDSVGLVDGRDRDFEESVYLLDEYYTVVGLREARVPDAKAPAIGECFFDRFKASPEERAMLRRMRTSISRDSLLMRAGGRPVLFLSRFFTRTHLLVAIVPQGEVRACFEAPGAFADVLEEMHVQLSAEARVPGEPLGGDQYALLCEWLARVHIPLFFEGRQISRFDADVVTVATRLAHLAQLCGCRMEYDLSGFRYESLHTDDFDLLIGTAFAAFLMVHRVGRERSAAVYGERRFGEGPTMHVRLYCESAVDTLTEIEVLCRDATARNGLFELYQHENSPYPLHLQFSFGNKELSAQDVKVKIAFETGADMIRTYSVTDEDIAAVQNEINAMKQ